MDPVVPRIIDPTKHSDGMFRWVYDLTNDSELSWVNALNNGKSVLHRNTGNTVTPLPPRQLSASGFRFPEWFRTFFAVFVFDHCSTKRQSPPSSQLHVPGLWILDLGSLLAPLRAPEDVLLSTGEVYRRTTGGVTNCTWLIANCYTDVFYVTIWGNRQSRLLRRVLSSRRL
ncbi:hypothetical protein BGY98DRAFT_1177619 [Russula aff. rugulosa BPL654]|nr:hypothetical protein BGY98DRAFT_1177619 [Russula aff. rugulosa BPL654]